MSEPITGPSWIDQIVPAYGTVTGQYVAISYDSSDANLTPDVQPLNGTITLTPTVTAGRIDTALAQILAVKVRVFGGQIVDDEDQPGVRILSTDTDLGVQDWAWTAHFDFESGLKLKPLTFKVATGETVNLTSGVVPVESAPYQIVEGVSIVDAEASGEGLVRFELSDGSFTRWVSIPAGRPENHTHGQIENGACRWSVTSTGGVQLVVGSTEKFAISPDGVITAGTFPSLTGIGTPQGAVYAGEGAIYTETSTPTADYFKRLQRVKKTPITTNNGWDVISGYTERDIRPIATNVNSDATVRLMVKDGWNGIRFSNLKPQTSGAAVEIFPASGPLAGYAPNWTFNEVVSYGLLGATRTVQVSSAGRVAIFQGSTSDVLNGTIWWPRLRNLPVAWIGDAA